MTTYVTQGNSPYDEILNEYLKEGSPRTIRYDNLVYLPAKDESDVLYFVLLEESNPLYDNPNSDRWSQYYGYKTRNTIKPW